MPLAIVREDITRMRVDAIVNAANASLLGGGGVDGAIHRAAGSHLQEECAKLGGCEIGDAKYTKGYDLPCKWVIHTVGPIWSGGTNGEADALSSCYRRSLAIALKLGCESVAFPLISAGAYGYPKDQALKIAIDVIAAFLLENEMRAYIVLFDAASCRIGEKLFADIARYIDDVYAEEHADDGRETLRRSAYFRELSQPNAAPPPFKSIQPNPAPVRKLADDALESAHVLSQEEQAASVDAELFSYAAAPLRSEQDLESILCGLDESFAQALFRKIDERGMTDVECYKRANIDRKLFSKIKSNPDYRPSKPTVLAFALSLKLSLDETRELLANAGYALSHSSKFDIIVEYCIRNGVWDINDVNGALFRFDQSLLGTF